MANWNIVSVDVVPVAGDRKNVISMARWVCKASSGNKTTVELGATALGAPADNFIEFADLSEADVMGFCVANGLDKASVEAKVEADLQTALSAPVPVTTFDWEPAA